METQDLSDVFKLEQYYMHKCDNHSNCLTNIFVKSSDLPRNDIELAF